jgi:hypothetical protein
MKKMKKMKKKKKKRKKRKKEEEENIIEKEKEKEDLNPDSDENVDGNRELDYYLYAIRDMLQKWRFSLRCV